MASQLIIGYTTEGSTDVRFLESIIQRTFEEVAFECETQIEVLPIINIPKVKGSFVEQGVSYCKKADEIGVMAICIHVDADHSSSDGVFQTRIGPLMEELDAIENENMCSNVVPVVPVQMSEAWMLADKELLKEEIGTKKSDAELGIDGNPELIPDPKQSITDAIRVVDQDLVKRRRRELKINDLYSPIGQKIQIERLDALPSFAKFKEAVRAAYKALNYLHY